MTDRAFLKSFAGLLVALVALTVVIFIVAQIIGGKTTKTVESTADTKAVAERIKPVGELTVGTAPVAKTTTASNAVMDAIIPSANAAGAEDKGKKIYDATCMACHAAGVAGAPKLGDKAAWAARIAQGADTLHTHAIKGFQGKAGMMPPKGGNMGLKDDDVKAAVDYMVSQAK
ncbi:MAG: cytochrome c5 family protein [Gammaproteobacteria bacterium]|nr:cytochrome c5 family protein [Gammaproteobacteria bacterium]